MDRYVHTFTPVAAVTVETSSSVRIAPSSGKIRLPPPRSTGSIMSRSSSTRFSLSRVCTRVGLPRTTSSPPPALWSFEMSATASSPGMSVVFQVRSSARSVLDTTYFGRVCMRLENVSPDCSDHAASNTCHVCFPNSSAAAPCIASPKTGPMTCGS